MLKVLEIQGYLSRTARDENHRLAKALKSLIEGMVAEQGDELVEFKVVDGVAQIRTKADLAVKTIEERFKAIEGVQVAYLNALEVERKRNIDAQKRADKMKTASQKRRGTQESQ